MKDFISINNQKIDLTEEQVKKIMEACGVKHRQLSEYKPGEIVKIGDFEMVVLEQHGTETSLILKDLYVEESEFGEKNNNFKDSYVLQLCKKFANELATYIGEGNIVPHEVDLTSDDGLRDYGTVGCRASLITAEMYRKYVDILDTVNPKKYWWLATPHSTKRHENDAWAKCVAPSGRIHLDFYYGGIGVRPFCILKSTIFVSN